LTCFHESLLRNSMEIDFALRFGDRKSGKKGRF